jgi:hypothetical protein
MATAANYGKGRLLEDRACHCGGPLRIPRSSDAYMLRPFPLLPLTTTITTRGVDSNRNTRDHSAECPRPNGARCIAVGEQGGGGSRSVTVLTSGAEGAPGRGEGPGPD